VTTDCSAAAERDEIVGNIVTAEILADEVVKRRSRLTADSAATELLLAQPHPFGSARAVALLRLRVWPDVY
jgi:hypothetical protein